jgi:hypothetical protein
MSGRPPWELPAPAADVLNGFPIFLSPPSSRELRPTCIYIVVFGSIHYHPIQSCTPSLLINVDYLLIAPSIMTRPLLSQNTLISNLLILSSARFLFPITEH